MYKFSSAPISASVSVISEDGINQVATVVVSQKAQWIHLGAYGFTFSSPTLRVKLSQKDSANKATITCIKGKTSKKVTAVKPKCPSGFKKK
jgi:hypothetical protein